jgi:hypothetical protein
VIISSLKTNIAVPRVLLPAVVDTFQSASVKGTSPLVTISIQSIIDITPFTTVAALPNFSIVSACDNPSNL